MSYVDIYHKKLVSFIKEYPQYIPNRINREDSLKLYHRYWTPSCATEYFKVQQIYTVDNIEYYSVKYSNLLHAEIPHPLNDDVIYDLLIDKNNIWDKNIIDTELNTSYLGCEIKYWFFLQRSNSLVRDFEKYLLSPISTISDSKYYFVLADMSKDNTYDNCRMVQDRRKNNIKKDKR